MQFNILSIMAALSVASSAAAVLPRAGTCTLTLSFARGQNPFAGGDNSYSCLAKMKYADGSEEDLSSECRYVTRDHCFPSRLPFSTCTHTNGDLKDGYVNYAAEHIDFNGDGGCKTDSFAGISGDGRSQECSFAC